MLKAMLMGGAMLLAVPALAQTAGTHSGSAGTNTSATGTTTNDHDPTQADEQGKAATGTATTGSQVNGGITSSSPGTHAGHSTGTRGSISPQGNDWSATGTATTGTSASGTGMTGTTSATGGPFQAARSYPPCTRARTDSCRQPGGR